MAGHSRAIRILSIAYFFAALLEGCLYFSPSPIYVLGFANPAINWWAFAMFAHALVFLGISACRFSAMAGISPQRMLRVVIVSFTVLNLLPALFYFNVGFAPVGVVLHLAPLVLLFPSIRTIGKS